MKKYKVTVELGTQEVFVKAKDERDARLKAVRFLGKQKMSSLVVIDKTSNRKRILTEELQSSFIFKCARFLKAFKTTTNE